MRVEQLLADGAEAPSITAEEVARHVAADAVFVVLDDDPTGTQSVAGLPVLTRWDRSDLDWALEQELPAVYVLTNTRSLAPEEAEKRNREVVEVAMAAASSAGRRVTFVSRSDSTLRGHFPLETDVLAEAIVSQGGTAPHLIVLVPAFPDAGRITVDSVHYWVVDGEATPVGETPFARDETFGYAASDLRDWVSEKSGGRIPPDRIVSLPLRVIRQGPETVAEQLRALPAGTVVAVDAVTEGDMRVVAIALHRLERDGMGALLRVGPPYPRAHIGHTEPEVVTAERIDFAHRRGGLVVVGSHVPLTTAQLTALTRQQPETVTIELDVRKLIGDDRDVHLAEQIAAAAAAIENDTVIVHTSRELVTGTDGDDSLRIARAVSSGIVELVAGVLEKAPPRFVVAKGGITSSDVASEALQIQRAMVVGPMLPGIVSLWQPVDGPARGIPYVVFAGNVGHEDSLAEVVRTLST